MNLRQIPLVYRIRIRQLRLHRILQDALSDRRFATRRSAINLPHGLKRHQSPLRRRLGMVDMQLQENKVVNLAIAVDRIDGVLIGPGETFSFWRLVGDTTAARGYLPGLELWHGEARTGIGGGICQLANLLHWMALHTPMEVVERHHHSFDPFPDDRRVLPFGTGASVFYNYFDLRFYNPTEQIFQFRVWLTGTHLKGAVFTDRRWPYAYHLEERNHRFLRVDGRNYRENEIWRSVVDIRTGTTVRTEQLMHNRSEVKYELAGTPGE